MSAVDDRLRSLGVVLPEPAAPVANHMPCLRAGDQVHLSGQISLGPDGIVAGRLGDTLGLEAGQEAARLCAINLIAQFKAACDGDLSRVRQVVRLGGFVNAKPGFVEIAQVINGASDLMVQAFGDAGRHARAAVGVAELPLGAAVEVDAVIKVA